MTMVSSAAIIPAASRAMASFCSRCKVLRAAKVPSVDRTDSAPP